MADVLFIILKNLDPTNPLKTPQNTLKTPQKLSDMICVYFSSRLIVFYNSQEAINWNEDTFKYSGCFVYHFKKKLTPKTLQKPPKKPKNPENPKIKIFQNMSCGVSLESYGPGEQF